ncbi:hypothetical protein F0U60_00415 [Archangium minus]|uniref:Uncharacterized protein n=1 Tax=Archangium minus TaxID=83450 RepID=A0ABY9WLX4_9BACT|nr:hypothetical protein F0U60_00415 [Archangium minus]
MPELADDLRLAARHGVNAITIGEEAFFPWTTSKAITEELDALAKAHDCTLTGSGYQDVFWGNLIAVLAGSTHRIDRIQGLTQYNADDYGSALAQKHGVGLDLDTFAMRIGASNSPSYVWNSNEWLCARLGWRVRSMRQQLLPTTHHSHGAAALGEPRPGDRRWACHRHEGGGGDGDARGSSD